MKTPAHDPKKIGERLELLRIALGVATQAEFGALLGATRGRTNNWFVGLAPIPIEFAVKLKTNYGVTLDYIYCGDKSSLPLRLATSLAEAEEDFVR